MTTPFVTLPGTVCRQCGSAELRVIVPGTDADRHDLIGLLSRPVPDQAWCGIECARVDGWPWWRGEQAA